MHSVWFRVLAISDCKLAFAIMSWLTSASRDRSSSLSFSVLPLISIPHSYQQSKLRQLGVLRSDSMQTPLKEKIGNCGDRLGLNPELSLSSGFESKTPDALVFSSAIPISKHRTKLKQTLFDLCENRPPLTNRQHALRPFPSPTKASLTSTDRSPESAVLDHLTKLPNIQGHSEGLAGVLVHQSQLQHVRPPFQLLCFWQPLAGGLSAGELAVFSVWAGVHVGTVYTRVFGIWCAAGLNGRIGSSDQEAEIDKDRDFQ